MQQEFVDHGWRSLFRREWISTLIVLLGGVLLQSMNILMLATILPSIVSELGGIAILSWPTTAYLALSIVAASCAGMLATRIGARTVYCAGVSVFCLGALLSSLAPTMGWIVTGRVVQGFGGGLEAAVAYIVVRETFPRAIWSRVIALMSTSWSVSVLIGPLVGGMFAHFGNWRSAFFTTAAGAGALAIGAFFILPAAPATASASAARVPAARVALICLAIAGTSLTSVVASPVGKVGLIVAAIGSLAIMLRLNRLAPSPLLPRDAFSLGTQTGVGLWLAFLLCVTYAPLQLYVPMFLQQLHGLDPLAAGLGVASASLAWSAASLATAGASDSSRGRLIVAGPATMAVSLIGIAALTPHSTLLLVVPAIVLLGVGIGQCWPFVAQRIMEGAKAGDETVAASSVPTVQQMGFALGAAIAGLIGNAAGLSIANSTEAMMRAATWVPGTFVISAILAALTGLHLRRLRRG
jgi:MFS family permease